VPDLGYFSLALALAVSAYAAIAAALGAWRRYPELVVSARNAFYAAAGLLTLAATVLIYALLSRDFSVAYVTSYTCRDLPIVYTLSAFYAGNAGSLLFWAWTLSLFGSIFLWRRRPGALVPYSLAVIAATLAFFLSLLVFISNPFQRLPFPPADGKGLNPLLENPGMLFHPPTLLLGYMGFTIPFALTVASLIAGRSGGEWLITVRRWTLIAWLLLSAGNLIGAQWAYNVLGWGGYWAWDPVENAGLMPWLTATAFFHSLAIQKRRSMFKVWNMILIIVTFNLAILGTFLTRSGILSSVHAFTQSGLGPPLLAFITVTLSGPLALLMARLQRLKSESKIGSFVSRENVFLLNNFILIIALFVVLLGTFFPIISETIKGVKVTVGPSFFNKTTAPLFLFLILLMGLCPLIGWRRAILANLRRNLLYPLTASLLLGVTLAVLGAGGAPAIFGFTLCVFAMSTIGLEWLRGVRVRHRNRGENYFKAFASLIAGNRPRYGGYIVHIGILLIAVGVIGSSFYKTEKEAILHPGETVTVNRYMLKYEGIERYSTARKEVMAATLSVYEGGKFAGKIAARKEFYSSFGHPVARIALKSNFIEDLYIIFSRWHKDGSAAFKILVNPLVSFIWLGGVILVIGTLLAFWPGRSG
jgi:cytochrome c-type biogenesis protein CcmF